MKKKTITTQEFYNRINFNDLRNQKLTLLDLSMEVSTYWVTESDIIDVNEIIKLIDLFLQTEDSLSEATNTNTDLLSEQKKSLRHIKINENIHSEQQETIEGVLGWIDGIQDYAVDELEIAKSEDVFLKDKDNE